MDDFLLLFFGGHPEDLIAAEEHRFTEPVNQLNPAQLLLNALTQSQFIVIAKNKISFDEPPELLQRPVQRCAGAYRH